MNNKREKDIKKKFNRFIKKARDEGIFEKKYASKEEKYREIRKIISENFNVHAEFIGIEEKRKGNKIATNMFIEEPFFYPPYQEDSCL